MYTIYMHGQYQCTRFGGGGAVTVYEPSVMNCFYLNFQQFIALTKLQWIK